MLAGVRQVELLRSIVAELLQVVQVVELLAGVRQAELLRSIAAELVAVVCVAPGRMHPCG